MLRQSELAAAHVVALARVALLVGRRPGADDVAEAVGDHAVDGPHEKIGGGGGGREAHTDGTE